MMFCPKKDVKRSSCRAYVSLYVRCVVQTGRRLGAVCGSEKAGVGCALLAVMCLVGLGLLLLARLVQMTSVVPEALLSLSASSPARGRRDRDTSAVVDFSVRSVAFRDMSEADQQRERELHVRHIEERLREAKRRPRIDATYVIKGETDPNAFRLTGAAGDTEVRPVDAVVDGYSLVRQPGTAPLPRMHTMWRVHSPAELYERYDALDVIYSFVNGSEANHAYRKQLRSSCGLQILALEKQYFLNGHTSTASSSPPEAGPREFHPLLAQLASECRLYQSLLRKRNGELLKLFGGSASTVRVDERDRETDELRHSLRSVEQHVQWHRGRVVMVSPGHHPTWVDGAKNFLAGVCGGARVQALRSRGTHLRVTTVHQDAVMPYGMRLTVDSHVIEQHLWRVRNVTAVHVYMNDDYFVNRDVAITDLFNEYGGTIVRTEGSSVAEGCRGDTSASWSEGVANTELFNIYHLEQLHEDYLPRPLLDSWRRLLKRSADGTQSASRWLMSFLKWKLSAMLTPARRRGVGSADGGADDAAARAEFEQEARYILGFSDLLSAANTSSYWEAALSSPVTPTSLPSGCHKGVQKHYYATHAPFVYCTNMFRHWSVRFRDEFADLQLHHRDRRARDLFVPFLYNAFIMARPWQASPKFLPYLLELREAMEAAAADAKAALGHREKTETVPFTDGLWAEFQKGLAKYVPTLSIFLDNDDGCAPATLYRNPAAEVMYMRATNNITENRRAMDDVARQDPVYFNINAGFSSVEAADQLRGFLHGKFPTPVYLEVGDAPPPGEGGVDGAGAAGAGGGAALRRLFGDLMALPVVGVVSYEEGVCPLVRSLALAFAGHHRGGVRVSVERHGGATLCEARAALGHRVVSAMPAPACAYTEQVSVDSAGRGESVAEIARRAMGEMRGGVELPSTCGGGGAGLRVRGFVVDARTRGAPVRSAAALRDALAVPAQTLSLEDFRAVAVGPSAADVVLVVSREDAEAKAVHWVNGASESDLLVTYPLPVEAYEDMAAEVRWSVP
ncbi:conserved hypothetical protein [Leishmania mexicana MHOM/GT/2001/U1103]|uniref:Stealth protein CR3 conserved region 3 domain-containing protein n=1 Tax=Leishmania mexicana (strain MHOM/GT/2001/U1103) TaxID=929439 RepID=E9AQR3_LEIMU|nr:conserved hypothetical protein [Leishmania mexicana MHOM/GT/2001/U1103]CBZ25284.1 conserved hypothetical protein [Leishmania mexicana MHOM/GT/2001/U1103]